MSLMVPSLQGACSATPSTCWFAGGHMLVGRGANLYDFSHSKVLTYLIFERFTDTTYICTLYSWGNKGLLYLSLLPNIIESSATYVI